MQHIFQWMYIVDGFVFWHLRFVPIEIRQVKWKSTKGWIHKSLSIHAYSFESFISNTTITYPKTFDTQNLPLQHFHTSGRFHQRFPPLLPKKVPKNRAPAHEARTWHLYFSALKQLLVVRNPQISLTQPPSIFRSASRAKALSSCLRRPKSAWLSRPRPPWAASLGYPNHFSQCLISCPQLHRRFFKS